MTKNRSMKIAVLVLALALLTSCFVGSTFAKYASTGTGTATVTVADWEVLVSDKNNVDGLEITGTGTTLTFDLFTTVNDTKDGSDETDVADGMIAPGTKGSFNFKITNKSDVKASYAVTLTGTDVADLPIVWKVDGESKASLAEVSAALVGDINFNDTDAGVVATTKTVEWEWAFNDANENDYAGTIATLTVQIAVEQVD